MASWLVGAPLSATAASTSFGNINGFGQVSNQVASPALPGWIQCQIDNSPAGGCLELPAGVFFENLVICKDFTLRGAGVTNTIIDGQALGTVVSICAGATVSLCNLTIRNGLDLFAGGISNAGHLTLSWVLVTSNRQPAEAILLGGAGLFNVGTALLQNSIFSGNRSLQGMAGAIFNSGTIRMNRTDLVNNSAEVGAVYNGGTMHLTDATVSHNGGHGVGGIVNSNLICLQRSTVSGNSSDAIGGLRNHPNSSMALTNCTISGNSGDAENGAIGNNGCLILESCTVSSNRSVNGISAAIGNVGGTCQLAQTIVALNFVAGTTVADLEDSFISLDFNLIGGNDTGFTTFTLTGETNHNLLGVDPLLGPLQDNGGPTETHALLAGSPAIDAARVCSSVPTDQRGVTRPQDGDGDGIAVSDIGAYEKENPYRPHIRWALVLPDGHLQLCCFGIAGRVYCIQVATNLLTPVWVTLATCTASPDGLYTFTDTEWRAVPKRFYRILEE